MADRKSLLLEAWAYVGWDSMFKGCVRANPLWGEPCAGSMLACWWALLRCCQRHHDNGQSMQNDFRSADGSRGINETHTKPHALTQAGSQFSSLVTQWHHSERWEVGATSPSRKLNAAVTTDPKTATQESCLLHMKHKHKDAPFKVHNPTLNYIILKALIFRILNKNLIQNYLKPFRITWQRSSRVLRKSILFWC